jgi:beta-lactam-binding protein with PASTA domain
LTFPVNLGHTDTTKLENVINPHHQQAIQEKTKKRHKEEKAQRKKDDKAKKDKR